MTNIHFPVDGQGTQSLQKQNKVNKSAFHIDTVTPEPKDRKQSADQDKADANKPQKEATDAATIEQPPSDKQALARAKVSRNVTRRESDRRQNNAPVLLNTRSDHDRRKNPGQRQDDNKNTHQQFGIDTNA